MKDLPPNKAPLPPTVSESLYRTIFDATADAVIVSDPSGPGRVLDVNPAVCLMFGYTREQFLQLDRAAMLDQADIDAERLLKERAETGRAKATLRYRRRDGSYFLGELSSSLLDFDGACVAVTVIRDMTERGRAEVELQRLSTHCRLALDAARLGWWQYNPITRIADWDERYKAIFGVSGYTRSVDEILRQIIHPDDLPTLWSKVEAALNPADPQPFAAEYRIRRADDGQVRWVKAHGIATFEGEGNARRAVNFVGTVEDITERKQAEEALKESKENNEFLASILERASQPFGVGYPDGSLGKTNRAFEELTGYTAEELKETDWSTTLTPPEWRDIERQKLKELRETGQPVRYEKEYVRKDGTRVPIELLVHLARDDDGGPKYYYSLITDITEHKRVEEELRGSRDELEKRVEERTLEVRKALESAGAERKRLYDVLETLPVYVALLNKDYRLPFANHFFRSRFGESEGRRCYEYLFNRTEPCEICETYTVLKTNAPHHWYWTGPDKRDYDIYDYPFVDADGSTMILEMGIDITDQKQAEAEVQRAYQELLKETEEKEHVERQLRQSQKLEALGTLTGGIAHDFNNILAAIIGFSEIAESRTKGNAQAQKAVKRIFEAGIRGRELVKQMLTFSRKTEQEQKPLLLSSIVKETIKLLRASIPTTISIRVDVKSESGLVLGDPVQIQQVLMNLCTNAAHAMQEKGGVLTVELSDFSVNGDGKIMGLKSGLYMRLVVRDTGTGIAPEHIDSSCEPFFTTKKLGEGTGLGLSVVHGIVRQHGGVVKVESEPGKGSTFAVYLPKISETRSLETALDEGVAAGHERILFVDDEEALAEMGEELLTELGYRVTVKLSSSEALALFSADPSQFDLLLTDQTMPDMTGMELAREVMALRPDMPVVLSTGFSQLVDADKAREAGIRAFAMKPLTKKEIGRTVRKVLDECKKQA